jgi:hypothetical protein
MTTLPDPHLALDRLGELYRQNLARLGMDDVVVANVGGSGQSLIGNILFEAGLNYVDAYTEVLHEDGHALPADEHTTYRQHFASLYDKDNTGDGRLTSLWPRFVKTHHPPIIFDTATIGGVWLLVRDPRDTIYAGYQWRAAFGEEVWDQVPETFLEFLRGHGDFSSDPVADWCAFHTAWLERARQCAHSEVLTFEDLKTQPVPVVSTALRRLGVEVDEDRLRHAVEASSFARMREHEDRVSAPQQDGVAQPRMVRAGKVDGWREWMTPELAPYFSGAELRAVAGQFGYDLSEPW